MVSLRMAADRTGQEAVQSGAGLMMQPGGVGPLLVLFWLPKVYQHTSGGSSGVS